jgi:hypothetical protein
LNSRACRPRPAIIARKQFKRGWRKLSALFDFGNFSLRRCWPLCETESSFFENFIGKYAQQRSENISKSHKIQKITHQHYWNDESRSVVSLNAKQLKDNHPNQDKWKSQALTD